VDNCS